MGMRPELKQRLDAIDRQERLRRWGLWAALSFLVLIGAYAYTRPSQAVSTMTGAVERSVVGVNHWGQEFHELNVRLADGRRVPVDTFLVKHPLKIGSQVMVTLHEGFWGNAFYTLQRQEKAAPKTGR
jgi:hypothetical protein